MSWDSSLGWTLATTGTCRKRGRKACCSNRSRHVFSSCETFDLGAPASIRNLQVFAATSESFSSRAGIEHGKIRNGPDRPEARVTRLQTLVYTDISVSVQDKRQQLEIRMKKLFTGIVVRLCALLLNTGAFAASERGTADEAMALVKKAAAYLKANGRDKGFAEISDPKGQFVDRNLYIFVYDLKGTSLAICNGNASKMVGKNLMDMRDTDGKHINKNLI